MATKNAPVEIEAPQFETIEVTIVGTTPLIIHAWDEKAKREMLEKQQGKKTGAKHAIKVPVNDFINSLYWLTPKPDNGENDEEAMENFNKAVENGAK